jgi:tetratricopeptide (TPR) repeat protein
MVVDDAASLCRSAGALLQEFWSFVYRTPQEVEEEAAEIRDLLVRADRIEPGNVAGAVGLTVLTIGLLRGHVAETLGLDFEEDEDERYAGLEPDDETGRALADGVIRAARRTLVLEPANNLAAFALGYALEWLREPTAAVAAYREALRIDPSDEPAGARLRALGQDVRSACGIRLAAGQWAWTSLLRMCHTVDHHGNRVGSRGGLTTGHAFGFHLLTMCHTVDHHGETQGWTWLLTDLAAVRDAVDGHLDDWVLDNDSLEDTCSLLTHIPGDELRVLDLSGAVSETTDGRHVVDWSQVKLPGTAGSPLLAGQPIRLAGQLHFFGANQHPEH